MKRSLEKIPEAETLMAISSKDKKNDISEDATETDKDGKKIKKKKSKARKEKSVLQTKLTKLAIQIGYAGKLL